MRLVFAGTPEPAVASLAALLDGPHDVVAVVTRPDAKAGRGRSVRRSPVGELADQHGIEVLTPTTLRDPDITRRLTELAPDCCPVVAYGALIPSALLALPTYGWVNLHFSLLPAWRGAAPVQAAIAAGDDLTGASTFLIEEGLDTGPIFGVVTENISTTDTSTSLLGRLAVTGARLLAATIDGIAAGELAAQEQPTDGISQAPKITVDSARVRWDRPAHIVDRQIRSVTDFPGAWSELAGARVKLGPVTATSAAAFPVGMDRAPRSPGALIVTKKEVFVATGSAPVQLSTVQPPGKRPLAAADWARGARLDDGVLA